MLLLLLLLLPPPPDCPFKAEDCFLCVLLSLPTKNRNLLSRSQSGRSAPRAVPLFGRPAFGEENRTLGGAVAPPPPLLPSISSYLGLGIQVLAFSAAGFTLYRIKRTLDPVHHLQCSKSGDGGPIIPSLLSIHPSSRVPPATLFKVHTSLLVPVPRNSSDANEPHALVEAHRIVRRLQCTPCQRSNHLLGWLQGAKSKPERIRAHAWHTR